MTLKTPEAHRKSVMACLVSAGAGRTKEDYRSCHEFKEYDIMKL